MTGRHPAGAGAATVQIDLFGEAVTTPAGPHRVAAGWRKNPDPRAWQLPRPADAPFHLLYYAACLTPGCGTTSGLHERENDAIAAGMDHAWPGWRTLPVVAGRPDDFDKRRAWLGHVAAAYPDGWVAAGGPARTTRIPGLTRSWHDEHLGYWDICGQVTPR